MSFKNIVKEQSFITALLGFIRNTEDIGEYLAGDCYPFAAACYMFVGEGDLYIAEEDNVGQHAFYCNFGKCFDANGVHKSKDDLIDTAEMGFDKPTFKKVSIDVMLKINNGKRLAELLVKDFEEHM